MGTSVTSSLLPAVRAAHTPVLLGHVGLPLARSGTFVVAGADQESQAGGTCA